MNHQLHDLSSRFPCLEFFTRGELIGLRVRNDAAEAVIYLQGAQVAEYGRPGEPPLLWLSPLCGYQAGKSLRGGVPVCWPWFGDAARNPASVRGGLVGDSLPAHGVVRGLDWQLRSAERLGKDLTQVSLELEDSATTRQHFPFAFRLRLTVLVGAQLELSLQIENRDLQPFAWSGALHTYFAVSDIAQTRISGLEGQHYVDTLADWRRCTQAGAIAFEAEVDRIYLGDALGCTIEDAGWGRRIQVEPHGSRSCVVWNPAAEKALRLSDFAPDAYRHMLCVETARALEDCGQLAPGSTDTLAVRYSLLG